MNPWSMFAVVSLHQAYAESSFSGLFGAFEMPILASLILMSASLLKWIQQKATRPIRHHLDEVSVGGNRSIDGHNSAT
jgi:hypothetical protein